MTTDTTTEITPFKRNPDTGLVEGVTYHRRPDGRIDWARMIRPEYVVFNGNDPKLAAAIEKEYGAPPSKLDYGEIIASGRDVNPRHILVLLNGWVEVAALRGGRPMTTVDHVTSGPTEAANVTCTCHIEWCPNKEEPNGWTSFGTADATMDNTGGWGYLAAMAGNRAFARAVKQGLRIPILAFDEIAKKDMAAFSSTAGVSEGTSGPGVGSPAWTLQRTAEDASVTFAVVKKLATDKYRDQMKSDPDAWNGYLDVDKDDCTTLIKLIKAGGKKGAK